MSGEQFLRAHGWKRGAELWWHARLPDQGHSFVTALQQCGMWLALELEERFPERAGADWSERVERAARALLLTEAADLLAAVRDAGLDLVSRRD